MVCQTHKQEVKVSTGIHGGLTFGHGELDDYGFWQVDCTEASEAHRKREEAERKWQCAQMDKWLSKF